jgi:hypothetical protein
MSKNRTPKVLNMKLKAKCRKEAPGWGEGEYRKDVTRKEEHGSKLRRTNLWKTEIDGETWSKGWRYCTASNIKPHTGLHRISKTK